MLASTAGLTVGRACTHPVNSNARHAPGTFVKRFRVTATRRGRESDFFLDVCFLLVLDRESGHRPIA